MAEHSALIFLSHSTQNKPVALVIARALEAFGLRVFLDTDWISPGMDWAMEIEAAMLDCHGALILLSGEARAASWVCHEAYTLALRRRRLDPDFLLIPLLLDGFGAPRPEVELRKPPFAAARLDEWQAYSLDSASIARDLAPVLDRLAPLRDAWEERSQWAALLRPLVVLLSPTRHAAVLAHLARQLACAPAWLADPPRLPRRLARRLFQLEQEPLEEAIRCLAGELDSSSALTVLRHTGPFCCVNGEAANRLAVEACRMESPRPALHINARSPVTVPLYLHRASRGIGAWEVIQCARVDDLLAEIQEELQNIVGADGFLGDYDDNPGDLDHQVVDFIARQGPIVVLLPPGFERLDAALLDELLNHFPSLTFIVGAGELESDSLRACPRLLSVAPPVDPDEERQTHQFYNRMGRLLSLHQLSDLYPRY